MYTQFLMLVCLQPVIFHINCVILLLYQYIKRGTTDPANYREISLVSCMTKLSSILNKIFMSWADRNDAHFGFRPFHSTVDAIFVLQTIVKKNL